MSGLAAAPQWSCPFCRYAGPPRIEQQVSTVGWVLFVVLIITCLPLFWIPLIFVKEDIRKCGGCGTPF